MGLVDKAALPRPTKLFKLIKPTSGAEDYKRLCNVTHGSLLTILEGNQAALNGSDHGPISAWWRVLTASTYGLEAAHRLAELRGTSGLESLQRASMIVQHYVDLYDRWIDSQ
ncbi:hypothetical protein AB0F43_18025 [Kribbella sp. NPDC023972]|uniref:hypothetical protein n=1 Tax=Kribbella sp. NPDC023972 TaxID=3154795 RepID=UPI00340A1FE0